MGSPRRYYANRTGPSSSNSLVEQSASTRNSRQETSSKEVILIDDEEDMEGDDEASTVTAASNQKRDRDSRDDVRHRLRRQHKSTFPLQGSTVKSIDLSDEGFVDKPVQSLPYTPTPFDASLSVTDEEPVAEDLTSFHKLQLKPRTHLSDPQHAQESTNSIAQAAEHIEDSDNKYVGFFLEK